VTSEAGPREARGAGVSWDRPAYHPSVAAPLTYHPSVAVICTICRDLAQRQGDKCPQMINTAGAKVLTVLA